MYQLVLGTKVYKLTRGQAACYLKSFGLTGSSLDSFKSVKLSDEAYLVRS